MTDITEADHDAVDWLYEMGAIAPHHLRLANEAFARHREQTERQSADLIETQSREIERLREALQSVINACDQGKLAPLGGPCGMTIEAQIRGSVYNRVPAWPVEEARAALAGDSHDQ